MNKQLVKILAFVLMFTFGIGVSIYALTTGYNSFAELSASEKAEDYTIKAHDIGSDTTILAIHGGGIERGTSELVETLNGYGKYNTYLFEGNKAADNGSLFLRAINFDEPKAASLVKNSDYTLSVIGAAGDDEVTYIGGQNKILAELIRLHLVNQGYNVKTLSSIPECIAGAMDSNIVNKNKLFNGSYQIGGVQIAISKGLRDKLVTDPDSSMLKNYSNSIHTALSESWPTVASNLEKIAKSGGADKSNRVNGLFNKLDPSKPNFDKKIDKILEKGSRTPEDLIKNVKAVSEE